MPDEKHVEDLQNTVSTKTDQKLEQHVNDKMIAATVKKWQD